ncbi:MULTISPECIES: sigma 54-interacting transcriptional regulator [Intestinimonas]|uniref:HTH-type transcriptional regulatory protein TyrR n=1 Tax=Intestinimonas massiliensis (ex Afouda et al. 2020) TaxID=1673721 RepID=A0ABS9MEF7_9FIRM|nr:MULTISPECIES: sigma 54-interacting transcriptional regulator [Intestinimonas]MBS6282237.1 sigma 54-interacting transcriptional regulator [Oscillospiraceae bacterium]CUQ54374.1 PAS domain S-box [Flavonifractor plautii]SCJ36421.1 (S)-limonene 6-monooxygenase [uncultured Flavonifractor sp.]MCG4529188.1 sigma 54-interacting transcriptional regulator [Intestinimonas massiliensis (ex Afouda et al. 2020)]MCQ4807303.1 sigma 54-interacting transcriptional regulator [Intestinimonas massiliensis (ex A
MGDRVCEPITRREEVYQSALDTIYCAIIILDQAGKILYVNESARKMVEGSSVVFEELLECLGQEVDLVRGSGRYQIDVGPARIVCRVNPRYLSGERHGSTIVLHQSKHSECVMQEMDVVSSIFEELNVCLESSHDGIMVSDGMGNVIRLNAALEKLIGVKRRDILGRNVADLVQEGVYESSAILQVIETGKTATVVIDHNGRQLLITGSPVYNANSAMTAVVANIRDMSELNDLRQKLEQQQMIAEKYSKELAHIARQQSAQTSFVACSREMKTILATIHSISEVDSTVLISGESGTGKEMVVNEIYASSMRSYRPIIKVNCGAIPPALFESELFGYEDGAFTGARRKGKPGFFELAHMGTLFLDEVGELPLEMQVKLLRVLQEGEIIRIGGSKPISVDVRIIAATNRDLWEMTEEGTFRQDLYYRLNVINIEVPPLRQRRDDIIPLVMHMLERFNQKYGKHKEIPIELGKVLRELPWRGNVRELENLIENLVVLCPEDVLTPEHLPVRYQRGQNPASQVEIRGILPMKDMVRRAERQLIANAQAQYSSMQEVAKALGVDVSTISRKLSRN